MPRTTRPDDAADAVYHVTARVNWRVFHLEPHACVSAFYRVLRECLARFGVDLLAFVLMSNHFHLVVHNPPAKLFRHITTRSLRCRHRRSWPRGHQKGSVRSQFMKQLMRCTSVRAQKELGISGRFWEKPHHARLVLDDIDLVATMAYDHLNPVEASMVHTPEDYRRSSAAWWRAGRASPVPLLVRPPPFGLTKDDLRERLLGYQASRAFRDAMAEFRASGARLGTREGLDALKRIFKSRGVTVAADSGVRSPSPQQPPAQ
ncbi:MAG: transposase [Planctomycetes bacterium]|nr:transposase [Planctomycetota bacterium]